MLINTKALRIELEWCQKFIEKKAPIPILGCALFETNGNHLTLTTTDLETAGITSLDGRGKEAAWSCAAPVGKLIKYLGKVDEEEVMLSVTESHWLRVIHGQSETKIAGMSKESYPELPAPPPTQITLGRLSQAVGRVAFAISPEESRFTLNGALLEVVDGVGRLIATDGHRLSLAPVQAKSAANFRALFPKKALLEAAKLDSDCALSSDDNHLFLGFGQRRIVCRKLTGNFPDYHRVVPPSYPNHIVIPVKATLKTLERVALSADERSRAVVFAIEGNNLTIHASSVDTGTAQGTIAVRRGEGVGDFRAGYNATYCTDFLSRTDYQSVAFCFQDDDVKEDGEGGAVVRSGGTKGVGFLTPDGWQVVVMPMRI